MSKYKYNGKCSQCDKRFHADTLKDFLEAIRKHVWKAHREWMIKKIKRGLKKRKTDVTNNPAWSRAILTGIFPPANIPHIIETYKGMSPAERDVAKAAVTALTVPVGGVASPIAEVILKALDIAIKS